MRLFATSALAALLAGCAEPAAESPWVDLDGASHTPLEVHDSVAHVLVFVTTDCPIANSYAPEIAAIVADHAGDPLRFFVVHVNPDVTAEIASSHAQEYQLPGPVLLDGSQRLARELGVTRTPEVAVVMQGGELVYRGRIDNRWGDLGRAKPRATRHDLRAALETVLAGGEVPEPRTEAVGCDLPTL